MIFRKHGWKKVTFRFPRYRVLAQRYNFDDYSSKGSTVHPVKKYHRNMLAAIDGADNVPEVAIDEQTQLGN